MLALRECVLKKKFFSKQKKRIGKYFAVYKPKNRKKRGILRFLLIAENDVNKKKKNFGDNIVHWSTRVNEIVCSKKD